MKMADVVAVAGHEVHVCRYREARTLLRWLGTDLRGLRVLDVAGGDGYWAARARGRGAWAVALDLSGAKLGRGRGLSAPPALVRGDALDLPFAAGSFDAVTISFGLRNVADTGQALAELLRVTRPGGKLVVCEFSHLQNPRLNALYEQYLIRALPVVARRLSGNAEAYDYLAESIRAWPGQQQLAAQLGVAGWSAVTWQNLSLGIVAVHRARRPA